MERWSELCDNEMGWEHLFDPLWRLLSSGTTAAPWRAALFCPAACVKSSDVRADRRASGVLWTENESLHFTMNTHTETQMLPLSPHIQPHMLLSLMKVSGKWGLTFCCSLFQDILKDNFCWFLCSLSVSLKTKKLTIRSRDPVLTSLCCIGS